MRVCSIADIFKEIGKRAQDSLVGSILAESSTRSSVLTYLERLNNDGALSKRQQERFTERVSEMDSSELRSTSLSTKTCYEQLIAAMKSHNWYVQNPAIDLIVSNGPDQAAELNEDQQVILGRNILQCADGRERSASRFIKNLSEDESSWPFHVVRGIALETFTNEKNEIRFKDYHLEKVLSALVHLNEKQREQLVAEIAASVDVGTPKDWVDREDFDSVIESLKVYQWTAPLTSSLEAKTASFPAEEDEA